ncbi:hypothetical protein PpBr36_03624 [Pyricularia pennisetigena]|uniref:hypothetical protein n=1 Tax=Pyricularia pennisetigena TaxID=1578925 RepID=UPI0011514B09|nr:hypothetical protein PpBr36_03624 [Pyricularia pennisetigena]TLS31345.1 hypothetical protein PpBr36_03624 [Pyricularia pennisetigena]
MEKTGSNANEEHADELNCVSPDQYSQPEWFIFLEARIKGTENQAGLSSEEILKSAARINYYSPAMWNRPISTSFHFDISSEERDELGSAAAIKLISSKRELVKNACYTQGYLVGAAISLIPSAWVHKEPEAMGQILIGLADDTPFLWGTAFASTKTGLSFSKTLKKLRRWWLCGKPGSYRERTVGAIDKRLFVAAWLVQGTRWSKETEWQLYSLCLDPGNLIIPSDEDIFIDVATAEIQMLAIEDQILDKSLRAKWPMPIAYDDVSDSN